MEFSVVNDTIHIIDEALPCIAELDYTKELWDLVNEVNWTIQKNRDGDPKYLFSNKIKKFLHQAVMDYFFGEEVRNSAYEKGMIIEHINNNGFDCRICNLYFLLKIKNTYKGWYYDKLRSTSMRITALNIFHIIKNHTFQITMGFNSSFANRDGKIINTLKLLYDSDYCTVLQDAESILEEMNSGHFNITDMKHKYRFKDQRIEFSPQIILTEEEKQLKSGNLIFRDGLPLFLAGTGKDEDYENFRVISIHYDDNWN